MNKQVWAITGANGALGGAVAARARRDGVTVAGIARGAGAAAAGFDLLLAGVELSDPAQAQAAMARVGEAFGRLDVLVNVAGGFQMASTAEGGHAIWSDMFAQNLLTAMNASRAALPLLIAAGDGAIVNVGAGSALKAGAAMGAYAAAKSAVHRLTEAMAAELLGQVRINAVLPGIIGTPANRAAMPKADFSRWASLDEVAEAIVFLAGEAASGVTGALLPVSGRA